MHHAGYVLYGALVIVSIDVSGININILDIDAKCSAHEVVLLCQHHWYKGLPRLCACVAEILAFSVWLANN
jgi:hypothetical protein